MELLKLEWKKHQLSKYIKSVVICIGVIFVSACLMAVVSQYEGEVMFYDQFSFTSFVKMIIRVVFEIFASIVLGRLIIDEYRSKTIQVLFTYPINRKKIIQYKLAIVYLFTFVSILTATIITGVLTYFLNPVLHLFEGTMTMKSLLSEFPADILSAVMISGISLIPLYFGMKHKSTATTITSAVIISLLLNGTVSGADQAEPSSIVQFLAVPIVFCCIGLAVGYLGYRNVNKIDII